MLKRRGIKMANATTYNGYTNQETWTVSLIIDNNEGLSDYYTNRAEEIFNGNESDTDTLGECITKLEREMEGLFTQDREDLPKLPDPFESLLTNALQSVNFRELAKDFIEEAEKEWQEEENNKRPDLSCDQCTLLILNGIPCHELGCPNKGKVKRDGEWIAEESEEAE
jgi:hypothetical protein